MLVRKLFVVCRVPAILTMCLHTDFLPLPLSPTGARIFSYCIAAQCNWTKEGISLRRGTSDGKCPAMAEFHAAFETVFVDVTGYVNLCAKMTRTVFHRVGSLVTLHMNNQSDFHSSIPCPK